MCKRKLMASSNSKKGIERLINEFYYSQNWIVTPDMEAKNTKTGKTVGNIENDGDRWKWFVNL